jgi:hypothetical protein
VKDEILTVEKALERLGNASKIVEARQRKVLQARAEEQATLQDIAKIATVEFAEEAAGVLDSRKHAYSFETYLILLSNLKELLLAGMPPEYALNSVQSGWDTDRILSIWGLKELLLADMPPEYGLDSVQTGWDTDRILSVWRSENE